MKDITFQVEKTKRACHQFLDGVAKAEEEEGDYTNPHNPPFVFMMVGLLPLSFAVDELIKAVRKEVSNVKQEEGKHNQSS